MDEFYFFRKQLQQILNQRRLNLHQFLLQYRSPLDKMFIKKKNRLLLAVSYVLLTITLNEHIIITLMTNNNRKKPMKISPIFVLLKVVMENLKPIVEVLLITQLPYLILLINKNPNNNHITLLMLPNYHLVQHNRNLYQILHLIKQKVNKHMIC